MPLELKPAGFEQILDRLRVDLLGRVAGPVSEQAHGFGDAGAVGLVTFAYVFGTAEARPDVGVLHATGAG